MPAVKEFGRQRELVLEASSSLTLSSRYVSIRYMTARHRSTRYAILGLLSLAPMSGYEIRKVASNSIGHFWSESYGQIYPTLRELAAEGLVRPLPQRRRVRDRQEYEITDKGRQVLAGWRSEPPRVQPPRNDLLLKLFFGQHGSIADHIAHVQHLLASETDRLDRYRHLEEQIRRKWREHPSRPFWHMTVSYGRQLSEALIRWSQETLESLKRETASRSAGKGPRARKRVR